jgi:oligoribonuclease
VPEGIDPRTGRWDWSIGRICWLDVETTGLWDPASPPLILEVAAVVTDQGLEELGRMAKPILYEEAPWSQARPHESAVAMHRKSGLWRVVNPHLQSPEDHLRVTLAEAENQLCQLLDETDFGDPRPVLWGGASPAALDRPVLRHYMPRFYSRIHYRTLDATSIRMAALNWGSDEPRSESDPDHRALPDCLQALEIARRDRARRLAMSMQPAAAFPVEK